MKNAITASAALLLTTTIANAGGIDRTGNPYSILFEEGNYVQLSFSAAMPEVSGEYPAVPFGGGSTENMAESYFSAGVALKYEINDQIDLAVMLNQPYGADANYTGGAYTGLTAEWNSTQLSVLAKYQANDAISVYGGLRAIQSEATIAIPVALTMTADYDAETEKNTQVGYVIGAAYEKPEIALRVALTYESGVTHDFATAEYANGALQLESTTDIEIPQTVTLDFQSGVAEDTLVFGSIRWSEWSVWEVRPAFFELASGGDRVTGIDDDVITYRLGVGRRINDDLSIFGRVTYEAGNGAEASRLSPTDGSTSIGIGGSYTMNGVKFTGGIEYAMLGDATDASGVEFEDNSAVGFGLSIGYAF
ncbi:MULTISPECIES: OmpP1/FadL family transporter [Rhodobacterales]|uniref:OmpP1/FadL family transporter n=1 Tax=Rhodobacterales TaxID=204455 RepID=UPI0015F11D61|nr:MULTISPECIES: outer membrane protein transport protein [Rhodobacterales]MDO6589565.1 outer membrane protein transport protein [Yoonia sp. 1_MG-2023]